MEEKFFEAVSISLYVSFTATVISLLFSLPLSTFFTIKNFPFKNILISLINALTSIPPVCAGLVCYLIISRGGPLGWIGILYTPEAMIIAQFIIITPIMMSLIIRNFQEQYILFEEEFRAYGAQFPDIMKLLIVNNYKIYFTISIVAFGRAISEYGAAAMVGGSIDQVTRNMTTSIARETSQGNFLLALQLGIFLIVISFVISLISQVKIKNFN